MNKILKLSIVTALSGFLVVGCSGTPDAPDSETSHSTANMSSVEIHAMHVHANLTQEKLANIVKKAGEDAGWKMSKFKIDSFIAEKTEDEETTSATVKFNKESVVITPENDDLKEAIEEALSK